MNDTVTAVPATETKLTAREKLVAKYEKLAAKATEISAALIEIVAEINAIDAIASIGEGTAVIITVGKGEDAREVSGYVTGVKSEEDGSKVYKVAYGSGFDADVAVVKQGRIKLQPAEQEAAPAAE